MTDHDPQADPSALTSMSNVASIKREDSTGAVSPTKHCLSQFIPLSDQSVPRDKAQWEAVCGLCRASVILKEFWLDKSCGVVKKRCKHSPMRCDFQS